MKKHMYRVSAQILAAAALAAGGVVQAQAQEAGSTGAAPAANETEEVVVTGFRNSLARALDEKRDSAVALDAILAEDIGKFPDLNLSESIQRVPGVALARDGGEGRQISVRGLGPQFTRVRINGMEALTTVGGADSSGGTNRGRSFDFNVFASDLFNSITVQKTADAATEEGSLGATVDLTTARPFDREGFVFSTSFQAAYNDLSEQTDPRGAMLISNTWGGGTLGALFSVAYTKRQVLEEGPSTVRWATGNAFAPGFAGPAPSGFTLAQLNAAFHPRFPRMEIYNIDQERLGMTGSLQWRPSDRTQWTLDALYADFSTDREEQQLEAPSFSVGGACTTATTASGACGIAQTTVTAATLDANNNLLAGTFNNVDIAVENRFDQLKTEFSQLTLSGKHEFNDRFSVEGVIGRSVSDHRNPVQTTLRYDQFNVQGYRYDFTVGRVPLLSYGSGRLNDPNAWRLTQVRLRPQTALNTYNTAQLSGTFKFTDYLEFSAGLAYKEYYFKTTERRRSNGTTSNQETTIPTAVGAIPISSYSGFATLNGSGLNLPAGSVTSWLSPSVASAATVLNLYDQTAFGGAFRLGPEPSLGNNRTVREKSDGAFVQADFDFDVASIPVRGNVGVRSVTTDQTASGFTFVSGAPVPITVSRSYDDTLPSANIVVEPFENFLVRFGASKVVARPDLGSLTPGATVSVSGSARTVTAGNPKLDPFRAKAYDLSFEWYFKRGSLLSLALFKKDIDSLVQTVTTNTTFTGNPFGLPDSLAVAACGTAVGCSPSANWAFSTPVNTSGGELKGFEVNLQHNLDFLPGPLKHTGVLLNYTGVESEVNYVNGAGAVVATANLTGLSPHSYNATLFYEHGPLSARVSAAYRARFFTRVPGQEAGTAFDGTNATYNVDASAQYSVGDHLKFTFEGVNLTDDFQDQFNGASNLVSVYHHTGRTYLFGVRYSY